MIIKIISTFLDKKVEPKTGSLRFIAHNIGLGFRKIAMLKGQLTQFCVSPRLDVMALNAMLARLW